MVLVWYSLMALVAYLIIGYALAIRNLPRAWQLARIKWQSKAYIRESVQSQTIAMVLGWPFYGTYLLSHRRASRGLHRTGDRE